MPENARRTRERSRAYCFTGNIDAACPEAELDGRIKEKQAEFRYLCFQLEVAPTTLQLHYQGYIHCGGKRELGVCKALLAYFFGVQAHLESAKGTPAQNKTYCSKAGGVENTFREYGEMPVQGARSDLAKVADAVIAGKDLADIACEHPVEYMKYSGGIKSFQTLVRTRPRDSRVLPTVRWWFGPTGVGKSRKAFDCYPDAYVKMNNQWWDGYVGQSAVIIDDYRPSLCTFQELLRILDRYPMRIQTKGSSCELSATAFVITTTSRPEVIWSGRTTEAMNQLLRRITEIIEFSGTDGAETILKSANVNYVALSPTSLAPGFRLPN